MAIRLVLTGFFLGSSNSVLAAEIRAELRPDGATAITIFGTIEPGDDAKFRKLSTVNPKAVVTLNSSGGAIEPALKIGRLIRGLGYGTVVDERCTSSCALIWLAGTPRFLSQQGRLGFHASYRDEGGERVETGVGNALVGHYLSHLDLSERAVIFATTGAPDDMVWLTPNLRSASEINFEILPNSQNQVLSEKTAIVASERPAAPAPSLRRSPQPSGADSTQDRTDNTAGESFAEAIRVLIKTPGFALNATKSLGFGPPIDVIVADHLTRMYQIPGLVDRMENEMAAAHITGRGPGDDKIAFTVAGALTIRLSMAGYRRLSDPELKKFFSFMGLMNQNMSNVECKLIYQGDEEEVDNTVEFSVLAKSGADVLREYLALMRKAVELELSESRPVVRLTPAEKTAGEKAGQTAMLQAFSVWPKDRQVRMFAAFEKPESADIVDLCDGYRTLMPVLPEMPGIAGDWYRRAYLGYITE